MTFQLRQPRNSKSIYDILASALKEYPDLNKETAIVQFIRKECIKNVFFLDEEGRRCIYRDEFYYVHRPFLLLDYEEEHCDCCERRFLVRKQTASLESVDRPKLKHLGQAVRQPSEEVCGWNLPEDHPRHFLKFPQEIRDLILEFALWATSHPFVRPRLIESNWKTHLREPNYFIGPNDFHSRSLGVCTRSDKAGKYFEFRQVIRKEIDASYLRTSGKFIADGLHLLYAKKLLPLQHAQ
ncbi:uncharacterized protein PAC_13953 [Phialocephala subalpina]|uniref:Uncharacterized protein n=1 Tax=Phialocephala subalpina TaxID=576137 RepID=A0A1L7XGG9_9HELO|nr:uncharacterized protein PAC_13953 [Phialocephala subalpina]